jgi:predicted DNA-binding antitoxin AbrB/MazE fold protein
MNISKLAKSVALKEGKKVNLPIAQVSEVIRHVLDELAKADPADVLVLLRVRRKGKK